VAGGQINERAPPDVTAELELKVVEEISVL